MSKSEILSVRVSPEVKERLDRLSQATERSKSWLAADAIRRYLEHQEWQVKEIEAGLKEADAGEFATEAEVAAVFDRWAGPDDD